MASISITRTALIAALASLLTVQSTHAAPAGVIKAPPKLPPLDHKLESGKPFDKSAVGRPQFSPTWIKIPSWMAGTWRTVAETRIWSRSEKTGKVDRNEDTHDVAGLDVFGKQADEAGAVWDLVPAATLNITREEGRVVLRYMRTFKVLSVGASAVTFQDQAVRLTLDVAGKKILGATQEAATTVYRPLTADQMEVTRTVSTYTPEGKLFRTYVTRAVSHQFKGFEQLDQYKGRDLRNSFLEFMSRNNRPGKSR